MARLMSVVLALFAAALLLAAPPVLGQPAQDALAAAQKRIAACAPLLRACGALAAARDGALCHG